MKSRIALTAAIMLAGMTSAAPHPEFDARCTILERSKIGTNLNLENGERLDLDAPLARFGDSVVTCKGDLGPGPAMTLTPLNTGGDHCILGPLAAPVAKTLTWVETIKANGEATLICDFGPH